MPDTFDTTLQDSASTSSSVLVRSMEPHEIEIALDWARHEGWNPGLNDGPAFYAADPNGFFLAEIDSEIAGVISAVAYDATYGFIGLYIVSPQHRGGPAGFQLLRTAQRYLGERNVGLDGVLERQDNYAKLGYRFVCKNARYSATLTGGGVALAPDLIDLASLPFEQVARYDRRHFPASRENFLRLWVAPPGGRALGILANGHLHGYGVIRPCYTGFKIGPLFAETLDGAEHLLRALASHAHGHTVFLDVPGLNPAARVLAEKHNMQIVFQTARMYLHGKPDAEDQNIYGITTFELG